MRKPFWRFLSPVVLLYTFFVVVQISSGIFAASGIEPEALYTVVYAVCSLWIIGWWMRSDSEKRGIAWVYDMGLFLYLAWPFILLYYLLKTRGLKGLLIVVVFAVANIAAYVTGAALYLLLAPEGWPTAL